MVPSTPHKPVGAPSLLAVFLVKVHPKAMLGDPEPRRGAYEHDRSGITKVKRVSSLVEVAVSVPSCAFAICEAM